MRDLGAIDVASRTPGRVRLRVEHPKRVARALAELGLRDVRANPLTGSVLVRLAPDQAELFGKWLSGEEVPPLAAPPRPARSLTLAPPSWQAAPGLALAAAAGFSLMSGAVSTAAVVGTALAGHAALGRVVRDTVGRRLQTGRSLLPVAARLIRQGRKHRVPVERLTPGDTIFLKKGDVVPADARLIDVDGLITGESVLTGQPHGVVKKAHAPHRPERSWMVYAGTTVVSGRGRAEVVATGSNTALARLRGYPLEPPAVPPLVNEVRRFGEKFGRLTVAVGLGVGVLALASGVGLPEILPAAAAALSLSALPQGLPALAAAGVMGKARRRRAVVRQPRVLQELGRATVVCLDKTGTLTRKDMWVHSFVVNDLELGRGAVDGRVDEIRKIAVLCSTARAKQRGEWVLEGSGTERALLQEALETGVDIKGLRRAHPLMRVWDRTGTTSFMLTRHSGPEGPLSLVKGAPEQLVRRCKTEATPQGEQLITRERRRELLAQIDRLAGRGLRVLGFARAEGHHRPDRLRNLTWVGLVTMDNPLRPAVREALEGLKRAGLRAILMTGDHPETAALLARQLGIGQTIAVSGPGFKAGLKQRIPDVLARASQEDKEELLHELRRRGEVVVMLGHDQRDVPVLRHANIGIAHGPRGSQLGADTADVVMLDDNLSTLPALVEESRGMMSNLRDALHFLASSGLADLVLAGATIMLKLPLSMSPIQLLWTSLVTDLVAAFALALEPTEPDHRPSVAIDDPGSPRVVREALTLAGVTLGGYLWGIERYGKGERAQTLAFTTATLCEIAYARGQRARHGKRSSLAMEMTGVAQAATVIVPKLHKLLGTKSLQPLDWAVAAAGAGIVYAATRLSRSERRAT